MIGFCNGSLENPNIWLKTKYKFSWKVSSDPRRRRIKPEDLLEGNYIKCRVLKYYEQIALLYHDSKLTSE